MQYFINANFASVFVTHYYNFYFSIFKHFVVIIIYTVIPCFRINKIAFLLKPLNFADSHYFNHTLISGFTVFLF